MHILNILQELKDQTGAGSKERKMLILEVHRDNQLLKDFFYWCLDPSINYWQSKITVPESVIGPDWMPKQISLYTAMTRIFDDLVTRSITGNKAKFRLHEIYSRLSVPDKELLKRIITGKPDVGFNISTVNTVWPKLVYDPAYMRCSGYSPKLVKDWDFENDWIISQVKADGMFVNVIRSNTTFWFETRSGERLDKVKEAMTAEQVYSIATIGVWGCRDNSGEIVMHGELVIWKDKVMMDRSKSNGLINKIKLGGELPKGCEIRVSLWDIIPYKNWIDHIPYEVSYSERFLGLITAIGLYGSYSVDIIEYKFVKSIMEAKEHFIECLARGLEGTVLKHESLIWKYHTSNKQLKMKNKFTFEMRVTGYKAGDPNGKYEYLGSVEIASECWKLKSAISGMTDKIREFFNTHRDGMMNKVIEVEANGLFINDDGSYGLMHPRYKEYRVDRINADTLERIIQQEKDAMLGKEIEYDK